jgi:hypothetical protein
MLLPPFDKIISNFTDIVPGSGNHLVDAMDTEDECQREEIGAGRYGCRCQKCLEDLHDDAENYED